MSWIITESGSLVNLDHVSVIKIQYPQSRGDFFELAARGPALYEILLSAPEEEESRITVALHVLHETLAPAAKKVRPQ